MTQGPHSRGSHFSPCAQAPRAYHTIPVIHTTARCFFFACTALLYVLSRQALGGGPPGPVGTPEDRKEVERAERDERSVAIRCHAAYDCWYWSLYLLWVPFVIALMQGELLWMALCPAVIVLHCAFYMLHIHRWSKKL